MLAARYDRLAGGPIPETWAVTEEPFVAVVAFSLLTVVIIMLLPRRDVTIRLELFDSVRIRIDSRPSAGRPVEAHERHADVRGPDVVDLDGVARLDHLAVADHHGDMPLPHHEIAGQ